LFRFFFLPVTFLNAQRGYYTMSRDHRNVLETPVIASLEGTLTFFLACVYLNHHIKGLGFVLFFPRGVECGCKLCTVHSLYHEKVRNTCGHKYNQLQVRICISLDLHSKKNNVIESLPTILLHLLLCKWPMKCHFMSLSSWIWNS